MCTRSDFDYGSNDSEIVFSGNYSDVDIINIFRKSDFFYDFRGSTTFGEIHLNFLLTGGVIISNNLIIPDELPDHLRDRIICNGQEDEDIKNQKTDILNLIKEKKYLKLSDRYYTSKFDILNKLKNLRSMDENYYLILANFYFKNNRKYANESLVIKKVLLDPNTAEEQQQIDNFVEYRYRYRIIDKILKYVFLLPGSYKIARVKMKILKKILHKIK